MKKLLIIGVLILTATAAAAQKPPAFADYRAKITQKTSKQPNLASRDARMFRTNLRNAAKEGVNFAGHFVLTSWGCGTGCLVAAIIDARTGKVFFPGVLQGIGMGFCELPENLEPLDFKTDSRLLVLSGFVGGEARDSKTKCGIYYLEWTGANFRQIKYVPKKSML